MSKEEVIMYEQLAFKLPEKLETFYQHNARYAKLTPYVEIDKSPVQLGNALISPGQFVQRLGHKSRSSFEMQKGYYLRYLGKADNFLLFSVNNLKSEYCYAFAYVDPTILLVVGNGFARDIRIDDVEIFNELPSGERW